MTTQNTEEIRGIQLTAKNIEVLEGFYANIKSTPRSVVLTIRFNENIKPADRFLFNQLIKCAYCCKEKEINKMIYKTSLTLSSNPLNLNKYAGILLPSGKLNSHIMRDKKTGRFISVKLAYVEELKNH